MNYYFGGTLHEGDPTYVKRKADNELFENLATGQFCYVLSSRQTGKSSLRVRTMSRLKQAGFACSVIDVSNDAVNEIQPSQWYANLVSTLTHEFDLDFDVGSWYRQQDWFSPLSRFREFIESVLLAQVQENVVIFIDEIDSLLSLPFPTDDFFALIRACHNTRVDKPIYKRLTFCLLGVATPSDLIRDKKRTPFNIGKGIELTRFTFEEARGSLTQGLAKKVDHPEQVLSEVLNWTGGQPFLTQKVCQLVIDKTQSSQPDIKQLVQTYVIDNWESQDIPEHLGTIKNRLLADERIAGRMLGLYEEILRNGSISADMSEEKVQLRLSGLVAKEDEKLVAYNLIYEKIFERNWIEEKLADLRPNEYAIAFNAWVASGQDDSLLLRGETMEVALRWKEGRSLSAQDQDFIVRSQESDRQDKQKANQILKAANRKAQKRILFGSGFLAITSVAAIAATLQAGNAWKQFTETDKKLDKANKNLQLADQRVKEKEGEARDAQAKAETANKKLATTQVSLQETGEKLEFSQSTLKKTNQQLTSTKSQLASTEQQKQQAEVDRQRANQAKEKAQQETLVAQANTDAANKKLANTQKNLQATEQNLNTAELKLGETEKNFHVAQEVTRLEQDGGRILRQVRSIKDGSNIGQIDTLLSAMQTGQQLKNLVRENSELLNYSAFSPVNALQAVLYDIQEKNPFGGNGGYIFSTSFSPDGKLIATGSNDGIVRLWNLQGQLLKGWNNGELRRVRDVPGLRRIYSVDFSPDGKLIATGSHDGMIRLWNLQGNLVKHINASSGHILKVSFSPDGKQIAAGSDGNTVFIWNLNGELQKTLTGGNRIRDISFNSDGSLIATGAADGLVHLWNDKGELVKKWSDPGGNVFSISFSPNNRQIATGSIDGFTRLWNLNGELVDELSASGPSIYSISFSPDGKQLATGTWNGTVQVWNLNRKKVKEFKTTGGHIYSVSFSPDGQQLVAGAWDGLVRLWNPNNSVVKELYASEFTIYGISFSRDGREIAVGSDDGTVRLWNRDGKLLKELSIPGSHVYSVSFSPDGEQIAAGYNDKTIRLWNRQGDLVREWKAPSFGDISSINFSPDGELIVTGSDDVTIWNQNGEQIKTTLASGNVNSVTFSPDSQLIAVGSSNGDTHLTNRSGELIKKWKVPGGEVNSISFSPDGQQLATGSEDGLLRLWNHDGELSKELKAPGGSIQNVAFSPDGKQIASGSWDGTVRLWSRDGDLVQELSVPGGRVWSVNFSPDGKQLATATDDGTVRLWPLENLDQLLERGCKWLEDYFVSHPESLTKLKSCHQQSRLKAAAPSLIRQGDLLAEQGDIEGAISKFRQALEWDSSLSHSLKVEARAKAPTLFNQAVSLALEGKVEEAILKFRQALAGNATLNFHPDTKAQALALINQGGELAEQGDIERAASKFRQALERDSSLVLRLEPEEQAKYIFSLHQNALILEMPWKVKPWTEFFDCNIGEVEQNQERYCIRIQFESVN